MLTDDEYKVYKGFLIPKDTNCITNADIEIRVVKDKCIAMIDFNHPKNEDIPIFLVGGCSIKDNKIKGIFEKTVENIKSLGTDLMVEFEGNISKNKIEGTYESSTNPEFKNKYFGTFILQK